MRDILIIACLFIVGCNEGEPKLDDKGSKIGLGASIITINECQYAIFREDHPYAGSAMVHAGNCNNQIHVQSDRVVLANGWEVYLKREEWDSEKIKAFKEAFESIYGSNPIRK